MSQWHRENPELCGTDADPWMQHESHRRAYDDLRHARLIHVEDVDCPTCHGDGIVFFNPTDDPQLERDERCRRCGGTGVA